MSTFEQRIQQSIQIEKRFATSLQKHGWSYFHVGATNTPPIAHLFMPSGSSESSSARMPDLVIWRKKGMAESFFVEIKRSLVYQSEDKPCVRLPVSCLQDYTSIATSGIPCWIVIMAKGVIYAVGAITATVHQLPVKEKHRGESWCDIPLYLLQTIGTYDHPTYTQFSFIKGSFIRDNWS